MALNAQARAEAAGTAAPRRGRNNLLAVLLSLVSGLGHFYLEHYLLGGVLFVLFLSALNGVFLASTLHTLEHPETVLWTSLTVLVLTWASGLLHAWRLSYGTDRPALEQERAQLLRAGLLDYLRDDLDGAARKLERAVALDVDWVDPDPSFHLGVVQVRLSERHAQRDDQPAARRARRRALWAFRTCQARDPGLKWRREVEAEQRRLKRRLTGTGRMRALPPDVVESTEMLPPIAALSPAAPSSGGLRAIDSGLRRSGRFAAPPTPGSGVTPAGVPAPEAAVPEAAAGGEAARGSEEPAAGVGSGSGVFGSSSGKFSAVRSSGAFPAIGTGGAPAARTSGSFPAIRSEGEPAASGAQERPTPARAPGRTSRRLLAKRLKRLLQEELGGDAELEPVEGPTEGGAPVEAPAPSAPELPAAGGEPTLEVQGGEDGR